MDARRPIGVAPASVPVGTRCLVESPGGLAARLTGFRYECSPACISIGWLLENSLTIDLLN